MGKPTTTPPSLIDSLADQMPFGTFSGCGTIRETIKRKPREVIILFAEGARDEDNPRNGTIYEFDLTTPEGVQGRDSFIEQIVNMWPDIARRALNNRD